jgi:hypothetical protein
MGKDWRVNMKLSSFTAYVILVGSSRLAQVFPTEQ